MPDPRVPEQTSGVDPYNYKATGQWDAQAAPSSRQGDEGEWLPPRPTDERLLSLWEVVRRSYQKMVEKEAAYSRAKGGQARSVASDSLKQAQEEYTEAYKTYVQTKSNLVTMRDALGPAQIQAGSSLLNTLTREQGENARSAAGITSAEKIAANRAQLDTDLQSDRLASDERLTGQRTASDRYVAEQGLLGRALGELLANNRQSNADAAQQYVAELSNAVQKGKITAESALQRFAAALEYLKLPQPGSYQSGFEPGGPVEQMRKMYGRPFNAEDYKVPPRPSPFQMAGFDKEQIPGPQFEPVQKPVPQPVNLGQMAQDARTALNINPTPALGGIAPQPQFHPPDVIYPTPAPGGNAPQPQFHPPDVIYPTPAATGFAQAQRPPNEVAVPPANPSPQPAPAAMGGPTVADFQQWQMARLQQGEDASNDAAWKAHARQVWGTDMLRLN